MSYVSAILRRAACGIVHSLLGIRYYNALSGHPVVGESWEGFVIENLISAAPELTRASFYRTSAGAQIDLLLEVPAHGLWAIDVKRGLSTRPERGFYSACEDLKPTHRFVVNSGTDRYPISEEVEAIGVRDLASIVAGYGSTSVASGETTSSPLATDEACQGVG